MFNDFKAHLSNWKRNPRRAQTAFIFSRLKPYLLKELFPILRFIRYYPRPLNPPIQTHQMAILQDQTFLGSVAQVKKYSCLDQARLANVWSFVKLVGDGTFVEVGSFLGGTAMHICNAIDNSQHAGAEFYSFDPFEKGGFEGIGPDDTAFAVDSFTDTNYSAVAKRLAARANSKVVQGFFPQAAEPFDLRKIAFCHLDVDLYEPTLKSLNYLAPRLAPRSVILVDDLGHVKTPGVRKAINLFLTLNPSFLLFELFPGQGLLLPRHLW
jgi:O-methyltransferase